MLGVGMFAAVTGCAKSKVGLVEPAPTTTSTTMTPATTTTAVLPHRPPPVDRQLRPPEPTTTTTTTTTPPPTLPPIPGPQPGPAVVISHAATATQQIALTIDDGYCEECVAGYVDFAERTGIHITFSPNGSFSDIWNRYAARLRPLIAAGQVQMANHTWGHPNLLTLGDAAIRTEIQRNEDWLQSAFGSTGRPWFRPPYGNHSAHTDALGGQPRLHENRHVERHAR